MLSCGYVKIYKYVIDRKAFYYQIKIQLYVKILKDISCIERF